MTEEKKSNDDKFWIHHLGESLNKMRECMDKPSLHDNWYAVGFSSQINSDKKESKVLHLQLFGEPIIVYRGSNGKIVCAQDRCPHRAAPLSMGTTKNGILKCRYHEWTFGNDGKCHSIPKGSDSFVNKVSLFTIPCVELEEIIWVYRGNPNNADPSKILNNPKHKSKLKTAGYSETIGDMDGNWLHHIENLIDFSHTYFIHKNRANAGGNYSKHKPFDIDVTKDKRGYCIKITRQIRGTTHMRFDPPNSWMICSDRKDTLVLYANLVPINKNHTRVLFRAYGSLVNKLSFIPGYKYMNSIENWKILDEDNMLIAGQSIRVDYLGAPAAHFSRNDDLPIKSLYEWTTKAINNDIKNKKAIWFHSWNANKHGLCSEYNSKGICGNEFNNTDIEDIMSTINVIKTPFGKYSSQAIFKEYPPSNKKMLHKYQSKLKWLWIRITFIILCVFGSLFYIIFGRNNIRYLLSLKMDL